MKFCLSGSSIIIVCDHPVIATQLFMSFTALNKLTRKDIILLMITTMYLSAVMHSYIKMKESLVRMVSKYFLPRINTSAIRC